MDYLTIACLFVIFALFVVAAWCDFETEQIIDRQKRSAAVLEGKNFD